jgi:hypothetical protein
METYSTIRTLWNSVPILSVKTIAERIDVSRKELKEYILSMGIASFDNWNERARFVSYCLEGYHMKRCKYCGLVLYDHPGEKHWHKNVSGFCPECYDRYKPRRYNTKISWYKNMLEEEWKPTNHGWRHIPTGRFLKKKDMDFFLENCITP